MNRTAFIVLTACLLAPFVRCTRQATDVAGGSTSTTNARLTGTVFDGNGRMAYEASVILRKIIMTPLGDSVMAEWHTTAGTSGDFAFDTIPIDNYVLIARNSEMGDADYKTKCEVTSDTAVQLTLSKLYVLKGRVCTDSSVRAQNIIVVAAGTMTHVHPDEKGFYTIPGIPRGQYDIGFIHGSVVDYLPLQVISSDAGDTIYIRDVNFANYNTTPYSFFGTTLSGAYAILPLVYSPGSEPLWYAGIDFSHVLYFSTSGTVLHEVDEVGIPALLLDDFDDGDNISMIGAITGKAFWYVYTDTIGGGNSLVLPSGVTHSFSLGITDSAAYSGKSVRTTEILRYAIYSPYAGIVINMEPKNNTSVDLSAMQSFSFMLKGKGQVRVMFWSRLCTATYVDTGWWGQFGAIEQCPATWTKIVIRPQDLVTPVGTRQNADGLKWQDAATNVFKIEFSTWQEPSDTVQIDLDQVYINGVSEDVFR